MSIGAQPPGGDSARVGPRPVAGGQDVAAAGTRAPSRRSRRARVVVRKIDPWSVLKFSLVFYFCLLLIVLFALAVIFAILKAFRVVQGLEELLRSLELDVTISGGALFKWFFLVGMLGTVVWSAVTVFAAFLYNLIADVVGGIEVSLSEPE